MRGIIEGVKNFFKDPLKERDERSRQALRGVLDVIRKRKGELNAYPEKRLAAAKNFGELFDAVRKIDSFFLEKERASMEGEVVPVPADQVIAILEAFRNPETRLQVFRSIPENHGLREAAYRVLDSEQRAMLKSIQKPEELAAILPSFGPAINKDGEWYDVEDLRSMFRKFQEFFEKTGQRKYDSFTRSGGLREKVIRLFENGNESKIREILRHIEEIDTLN